MKQGFKKRFELFVLGVVALALITSLGWFWQAKTEVRRIKAMFVTVRSSKSAYEPSALTTTERETQSWSKPLSQSAGAGWIYELFTPPAVFYHQKTAAFSVTPPSDRVEMNPAFAFELVAVKRELFRLQLTGYFGEPGAYTAVFTQPGKTETFLAREGQKFEDLGLTLRTFSVKRVAWEHKDAWPVYEWVAVAELDDERSATTVILDSRGQKFAEASVAIIKIISPGGAMREVREGDVISEQGRSYRIELIDFSHAEMRIACDGIDRVLRPAVADLNYVATAHEN